MKNTLLLLILSFALCSPLAAHHFKGLPHFSYFENYPQVPEDEFLAQYKDFGFSLTMFDFQGLNQGDMDAPDNVNFFLIIYNLKTNKAYQGPAQLQLMDGDRIVQDESFPEAVEESLYKTECKLGSEGSYYLRVTLNDGSGVTVDIPFILSSQKINWGLWIGLSLCILLFVAAIGARRARIMKDRQQSRANPNTKEEKNN